jgi:hypothetical protein
MPSDTEKEWQKFHKIFPTYALMSIETRQDIFEGIAEHCKDGMVFVETGIFTGGSFCFLGSEVIKRNKSVEMHAVDNFLFENISPESEDEVIEAHGEQWRGNLYGLFLDNVERNGLTEITTVHSMDSIEASKDFEDDSIDFIHFDGSHDFTYVKDEIFGWIPKLKENSIIAGHDYPSLRHVIDPIFGEYLTVVNNESYIVELGEGFQID